VQPQEVFSLIADSIEKSEKDKVVIKAEIIGTYNVRVKTSLVEA